MRHLPSVILVALTTIIGGLGLWVIALRDQNRELQKRIIRMRKLREQSRRDVSIAAARAYVAGGNR